MAEAVVPIANISDAGEEGKKLSTICIPLSEIRKQPFTIRYFYRELQLFCYHCKQWSAMNLLLVRKNK